jgi:hypothetical protein
VIHYSLLIAASIFAFIFGGIVGCAAMCWALFGPVDTEQE